MEEIQKRLLWVVEQKFGKIDGLSKKISVTVAPKGFGADFSTNLAMMIFKQVVALRQTEDGQRGNSGADMGGRTDSAEDKATNVENMAEREKDEILYKNPKELAEAIATEFNLDEKKKFVATVAGVGFINFNSSDEYFLEELEKFGKDFVKNISSNEYFGKKVICEFSDPNPFKVLHVGHLYTSIVGDAISKIVEFAGGEVVRANFGGDVGLHAAKTMYALLMHQDEIMQAKTTTEKAELMAKCYVEGTNLYEEDARAKEEIVWINKKLYQIVKEGKTEGGEKELAEEKKTGAIKSGEALGGLLDGALTKIYFWGREASYAYFKEFYKKVGVKFDIYYPESEVAEIGLSTVMSHVEDGVYEESDGAIVYKGEKNGLHTRVFVNKNGLPTYEAKDVGLIHKKWEDFKFDKSIVITGNDIIEYMKVVLDSIKQYSPELVERTLHLTHGNVRLPGNEKMSSRKGNFLKAEDVISMVFSELEKVNADAKTKGETKRQIAMGAIKYAFLRYKIGGDIIFDASESVSMAGNSGPYLQYAVVRAKKVLGKLMKDGVAEKNPEWKMDKNERALIKKIVQYPEILKGVVAELSPNKLCAFLYELAQEFSRFYEKTKVVGSEFEFERGGIVLAYLKVTTHGLMLLGIDLPEEM